MHDMAREKKLSAKAKIRLSVSTLPFPLPSPLRIQSTSNLMNSHITIYHLSFSLTFAIFFMFVYFPYCFFIVVSFKIFSFFCLFSYCFSRSPARCLAWSETPGFFLTTLNSRVSSQSSYLVTELSLMARSRLHRQPGK